MKQSTLRMACSNAWSTGLHIRSNYTKCRMRNWYTVAQCEAKEMCGNNHWILRQTWPGQYKLIPGQGDHPTNRLKSHRQLMCNFICLLGDWGGDHWLPQIGLWSPGQGLICIDLARFGIISNGYCHTSILNVVFPEVFSLLFVLSS